jgi:hypothetical protein
VFVLLPDPVGAGVVESLARRGGNATGFTTYEFGIGAKWLELLKAIAPGVTRAAVLRDASDGSTMQIRPMANLILSLGTAQHIARYLALQWVPERTGVPDGTSPRRGPPGRCGGLFTSDEHG